MEMTKAERDAMVEECAIVADKYAKWAEDRIREDEPAESQGSQIFALMSNTANDVAEMIRDLKDGSRGDVGGSGKP